MGTLLLGTWANIGSAEPTRAVVENAGGSSPWWSDAAFLAIVASAAVALLTLWVNGRRNRLQLAQDRRLAVTPMYGDALAAVVAWTEVSYRIARRTGDDPDTIAGLVAHVHDVQERVEQHCQWLHIESETVGAAYEALVAATKSACAHHICDAWERDPADTPAGQNLGALYKADVNAEIRAFRAAAAAHIAAITDVPWFPRRKKKPDE